MKFKPNENVLRVTLIVFCVIFGILSASLIALGVVYIDDLWWPRRYVGLDFLALPTLVIILGCLSFLMSLVGCFCAKSYNRKFFIAFIVTLTLILCLELTISIISFENMQDSKHKHVRDVMKHQLANNTVQLMEFENHYGCCGLDGSEPRCISKYRMSPSVSPSMNFVGGCYDTAISVIDTAAGRLGSYSLSLAILQILEIAVSSSIFILIK